jgi:signal transduction histidine kinase
MIIALLALLITIVWVGHLLLRRALTPLRWLQEGVTRLGAGDLTVTVPSRTRDELGVLTDAFNQMVARVRDMIGSRDQLLLDVSHELRSPLTRMKVALALCPDSPHHQSLATNIAEMEAMIDELLELERLRQGRGLRLEPHDLVAIAHEAVAAFAGQFPGVTLGDAPAQARVTVDADRVRSVLRNLLDNAAKYALPDSQPTRISIDEREQSCIVCIEDDGPGIPEQDRTGLFEPFFRADRSRSRKTGGYGLGLSLCKRIMDAHGGSITVRPSHGRGTTFVLTFVKRKKGNR